MQELDLLARAFRWTKSGKLLVDVPGKLSLVDPDSRQLHEITTREGEPINAFLDSGVWSPSGRYLAVPTPSDQYIRSSLYVVDTEGGRAEPLLDRAGFQPVVWLRE